MSYCTHCGAEVNDEAVVCINCGCPIKNTSKTKTDNTIKTLILVFLILGCISGASFLIPLAWCIPITLSVKNKMDNGEPISTSLKVCTLIFVSVVAGILLLCLNDD